MLMQEKLYDFSSDYRPSSVGVGDYSPVVVAAAVNLCRNTASPRTSPLIPYECNNYMPLYYSSKIFHEYSQLLGKSSTVSSSLFLSSATSSVPYLTMQLPIRTPSLVRSPSIAVLDRIGVSSPESTVDRNTFSTLPVNSWPVKRAIDGSVKANDTKQCENQRTQSVIMKVEDQRIVEVPTNQLVSCKADADDEAICKWVNCYQ